MTANGGGPVSDNGAPQVDDHHVPTHASIEQTSQIGEQLRRRREASWRLPPLESGLRDPTTRLVPVVTGSSKRCDLQAARRAWCHLQAHGLMSDLVLAVLKEAA